MKVFIIAFVCLWPVLLNTIDGVAGVDPTLRETARVYGIGRRDRLLRVTLPAAAPQIFAGMRTSLSLALILMVISEMVASTNGIGYFVLQSQRVVRDPGDVVRDTPARDPRLRPQRRLPAGRATRPAVAPRRARQRAQLMLARRTPEEDLRLRRRRRRGDRRRLVRGRRRRVRVRGRPVRLRQDDAAQVHLRPARADRRARCRRLDGTPAGARLPGVQPLAVPVDERAPERRVPAPAQEAGQGAGALDRSRRRSPRSVSPTPWTATRGSSRAACSSASRSPARSPTSRRSC